MSTTPEPRLQPQQLMRTAIVFAFLFALGVASLKVLQPFLVAGLWATIIVVATWPAMLWLHSQLGGRRWAAVTVMSLGLLILLVMPFTIAIAAAIVNAGEIAEQVKNLGTFRLPTAPAWVATLPLVGPRAIELWNQVATTGIEGLLSRLAPYAGSLTRGVLARAGDAGFLVVESLLALAFAALLYARGEDAAQLISRIGTRVAGLRGANAVVLATQAIRGVAIGVGGTAVIQSAMTGIGLMIAGVPFVALLSGVAFVSCLIQIGTLPVLAPAVIWVFWTGETGWGIFLLVWSVIVGTADNVLRPMLIKRGVDLPFWLGFTGVVGGLVAFGLVGMFAGPVVLAVARMLLLQWLVDGDLLDPASTPVEIAAALHGAAAGEPATSDAPRSGGPHRPDP